MERRAPVEMKKESRVRESMN
ncbi:uncharacterized protein G2W53_034932 [Senna tora]|uniref:Uncharacterized protein n=1 Tax=Senna tora TaxID=362788 RepID=A0A834W8S8_9FABA|nr:uncharacterized protein G2W53_034932 [Senna tora]